MRPIQPTMLWEATDPQAALQGRFHFASSVEATHWLETTLADLYDIEVISVDRLAISSYNLLAWLTTTDGHLLAKCCSYLGVYGRSRLAIRAYNLLLWLTTSAGARFAKYHSDLDAHNRLTKVADLLVWLAQQQMPVSVPLLSCAGTRQVRKDHLSIGVQRLIPGTLLDTAVVEQVHAAGLTLAQLHRTLAAYPHATNFVPASPLPNLAEMIGRWAENKGRAIDDPVLLAGIKTLLRSLEADPTSALMPQLVHRDYRAANILWHGGTIAAVLDFEDLLWSYRINDLAWSAVHLGTRYHHWGPVSEEVHTAFLAAYLSQHPLTKAEQVWLPRLMLWHSINLAGAAAGGANFDAAVASVVTYTRRLAA